MKYLISDVHGNEDMLTKLILDCKCKDIIMLGDVGFGFGITMGYFTQFLKHNIEIIQGNHDNANMIYTTGNCKTYNTIEGWHFDDFDGSLYIPGALSYDKNMRIENISWWQNEEMTYLQLERLINFVEDNLDDINTIYSHDCPLSLYYNWFPETTKGKTNITLDHIYELFLQNEKHVNWYHGHLHFGYIYNPIKNIKIQGVQTNTGLYIL